MAAEVHAFPGRARESDNEPMTAADTDDAALVRLAKDDPRAFAPLYTRYLDPIYRYCARRLGSREAAEDATSQIFTKALTALPKYRTSAGSFRSWLFTIAHNVITDQLRKPRPEQPLDAVTDVPDAARTLEERAVAAADRQTVRVLLAHLPDDQRQVVELRLAGLTGPEIAAVLGRSRGAVNSAQYRAMTRLRALMTEPLDHARKDTDANI